MTQILFGKFHKGLGCLILSNAKNEWRKLPGSNFSQNVFFFVPFLTLFEELKGLERKWALCVKALSLKYIIHLLLGLLKIPHLPLIFHPFSRRQHWDEVVKHYYDVFNRTLAEFGLVLRHLGTSYNDFLYEVKRALRGQFLCVAVIIPIGKSKWILVNCNDFNAFRNYPRGKLGITRLRYGAQCIEYF